MFQKIRKYFLNIAGMPNILLTKIKYDIANKKKRSLGFDKRNKYSTSRVRHVSKEKTP